MHRPPFTSRTLALACCALGTLSTLTSAPAFAQQRGNDAGSLLREQPKLPAATADTPAWQPATAPAASSATPTGPTIPVKAFVFEGALLISPDELGKLLRPHVGQSVPLAYLQALTATITAYYAERGYLARVVLPPQEIKNGTVTFRIVEGKLGSVLVPNAGERIDAERVRGIIAQRATTGEPLRVEDVGGALRIINEQPGIRAKSTLTPGQREGDTDVVVSTRAMPLLSGNLQANGNGSSGTGKIQTQGSVTLTNPTGRFDSAALLVNANRGSTFGRFEYSLLAHDAGLRLGANVSSMRYAVVPSALNTLDAHGSATTWGLTASFPLLRSNALQLTTTASYDNKRLIDMTSAGETGDREVQSVNLGIAATYEPGAGNPLAGGTLDASLSLGLGDSHQNNASARATDASTRRVEGGYSKLAYSLGYLRPIDDFWSVSASLRGQIAFDNLDSGDGFGIGGASGVRGFPSGDGGGDDGWVVNLSARRLINDQLAATVFLDAGGIRLNHDTWAGWNASNPRLPNRYELYGTGMSIDWRFHPAARLNATLGLPLGKNPGRSSDDLNADGKTNRPQLSFSVNAEF